MGLQYEHEQNSDAYYIPMSFLVQVAEKLALVHWDELRQVSPRFFVFHVPQKIQVAMENYIAGKTRSLGKDSE